ncbi:MAG: cupin domain-containing protein [Candidatus Nealsonbacteria bacterium]
MNSCKIDIKKPKRLFLEKGELAQIYDSAKPIRHIAYIEFVKGKTRGGHYHKRTEFFYIIRGGMLLKTVDIKTGHTLEKRVKEGDLIFLPPKIAHSFTAVKPGHVVEFSEKRFNPKDTIPWTI